MISKPVVLMILDGWGLTHTDNNEGNAIGLADIPNFQNLWDQYPHTSLLSSGEDVGLPEGQMGNSEVGHLNIGSGRVVYQELTRINKAIKDGTLKENPVIVNAIEETKKEGKALHFMGLLSDGGVHSHVDHLKAMLHLAKEKGLSKIFIHCFLDGRDVAPRNALEYLIPLEDELKVLGVGKIATVMGRYYAMDRDERWDRNHLAYDALVIGEGAKADNPEQAVAKSYAKDIFDEFVEPTVIVSGDGEPVGRILPGDTVIFYNFRADRARQITRAFVDPDFKGFARPGGNPEVNFLCMTQYDADIKATVAYTPQSLNNTLGQVISEAGLKQLRIAETEKYAHVTFFFNGGVEERYHQEERILIPSPRVATYDLKPEMSAFEVTQEVTNSIFSGEYTFILVNFANPDMVAHTGNIAATVKAIEAVDECIGRIHRAIKTTESSLIITADHGNAELMTEIETGKSWTAHSSNPVPFILIDDKLKNVKVKEGALQDIAPTILELLELEKPKEMTGSSLISKAE